jgi:hypothetical protein
MAAIVMIEGDIALVHHDTWGLGAGMQQAPMAGSVR